MQSSETGPLVVNLIQQTLQNDDYRQVLYTVNRNNNNRKGAQLVLMKLDPNQEIGMEKHDDIDQLITIVSGHGIFHNGTADKAWHLNQGESVLIPANTWHNIINASKRRPMRLYTIYFPAEHPYNRRQHVKSDEL